MQPLHRNSNQVEGAGGVSTGIFLSIPSKQQGRSIVAIVQCGLWLNLFQRRSWLWGDHVGVGSERSWLSDRAFVWGQGSPVCHRPGVNHRLTSLTAVGEEEKMQIFLLSPATLSASQNTATGNDVDGFDQKVPESLKNEEAKCLEKWNF